MSRKSKKVARIWNKYICPGIELAAHVLGVLVALACFWIVCVAAIVLFG